MFYTDKSCREFTEDTASKHPVPGGGSVSALVGALGVSLGTMVGNLTVGKKRYADVEAEMKVLIEESEKLRLELLELVQKDIDIFRPLSELYGMKAESDEEKAKKEKLKEEALEEACRIPLDIMKKCSQAIKLSGIFAEKGSRTVISDAGANAILCKAALQAASLNVYINTGSMKDRERARALKETCAMYLMEYTTMADEIFQYVTDKLKGGK